MAKLLILNALAALCCVLLVVVAVGFGVATGMPSSPELPATAARCLAVLLLGSVAIAAVQLALAAADGGHGVDGLEPSLEGFSNLLPVHHPSGLKLQGTSSLQVLDLTEPINGVSHGVDNSSEVAVTDGNGEHLPRAMHDRSLVDALGVPEDHHTDLPLIQVQGDAHGPVLKTQQFVRHRRGKALDARNAIARGHDHANLGLAGSRRLIRRDELVKRTADLIRTDGEFSHCVLLSLHVSVQEPTGFIEPPGHG